MGDDDFVHVGTIFITSIPASGKSTLGKHLKEDLIGEGIKNVKLLDGEEIRALLKKQGEYFGFSTDERNRLAIKIAEMAFEYSRKGFICIICAICHVRETRLKMRKIIGNLMEVYLDCPVNICAKRDYKGHYAKAFQGLYDNFIGVTEPYQKSNHAECILYTGRDSIKNCSDKLFKAAMKFLKKENKK